MAVTTERIKGRLRALFPKANLSDLRLNEISERLAKKPADDAEDSVIDELLTSANDVQPFQEIAKADDRLRTLEALSKKPEPENPTPIEIQKPVNDDVPAWAKSMAETNAKLLADIQELKTGKVLENKTNSARSIFQKSEVFNALNDEKAKEFFFKQINFDSEASFEDQVKELEGTYSSLVQTSANKKEYSGAPPKSFSNTDPTDEELDAIVQSAGR